MKRLTRLLAVAFTLFLSSVAYAQLTTASALVQDAAGSKYVNCTYTVDFYPNPSQTIPYTYGGSQNFNKQYATQKCDSFGNLQIQLPDNVNSIVPNDSQWQFSICSATGYFPGNQFCFAVPVTITGITQNITTTLKAAAAILPLGYPFPLTTKGDLFGFASSPARIPVGADGQCLLADSTQLTGLRYGSCGGGGGGGGGGLPDPGANGIVLRTALNTTAAILNVPQGSVLVSGASPGYQTKAIYDVRDWMTCDGVTNATAGMGNLLNAIGLTSATVRVVGQCLVSILQHPPNVTFDFTGGGAIKLIINSTAPGGGSFVQGSGQSNPQASPTSTCSATLTNTTAGNGILMMVSLYNTFGPDSARILSVTDTKNFYIQQMQTTLGNSGYEAAYVASSIAGGTVTVTANFSHAEKNACHAWEITGLGPIIAIDNSTFSYGSTTPFSSGAVSLAAGDFVAAFSEDPNDAQTCTAGTGYTQPAGAAGNVGTASASGVAMCAEYVNSNAGGSTSATQNFSHSPVASSWVSVIIGLKPGIATWSAQGGIINTDLHQICINCTGTSGVMDFTGNLAIAAVYPEWWGACATCSAAVNTPAIQASEIGAFGVRRLNGSGLNQYNKIWTLLNNYQINGEITFYNVLGSIGSRAQVWCGSGGGLTQTASNQRILDGQADAYFRIDNCSFTGTAPSTGFLTDFGYSGAQGTNLAPRVIDFYSVTWTGNNVVAGGLIGAKEGGGAGFFNVQCYDCETQSFTQVGWQIGTPTALAQNAISIGYCGDMNSIPGYGLADYGGGYITVGGATCLASMENGFATQTGFDVFCSLTQGPCTLEHYRSESRKLVFCSTCQLKDIFAINQSSRPTPGGSSPVGTIFSGSQVGGDGAYYKVTIDGGAFGGTGIPTAAIIASGGSSTTVANTNQTLTGSVTVGTLPGVSQGETMTQATTGATGVRRNSPTNNATITGTASGSQIVFNETMTQASTGVTCTEQAPSPNTGTSQNLICNNFSGTADSSHAWTGSTSGGVYTPSAAPSFAAASPILVLGSVTGSPDSSHAWTGGTSGGVYLPTQAPQPANYIVNAFAGMIASIMAGTNALCYGTVVSNTSTVITVSSWITRYPRTQCPGPDSTSTFIVEPGWNHGTVVSGGMTLAYMNENVIDGDSGASGTFEDVIGYGGQWHLAQAASTRTTIRHGQVSRQDWYTPIGATPQAVGAGVGAIDGDWDVGVFPPGASQPQAWSNLTSGGAFVDSSEHHRNLGSMKLCWNAEGSTGNTTPANEVCIGGRSDPNSTTTASRAIIELEGFIGSPAPLPNSGNNYNLTDQTGTDTNITGGPSTGAGNGGAVNFWTSNPGSTGTTVNAGLKRWLVSTAGHFFAGLDNTYDIGASAANRPRTVYAGTSFVAAGKAVPVTVASGATALNTVSIASATCDTVVTVSATGVATTDTIQMGFNGDPTAVTGYIPATTGTLYIVTYPTANNVNFKVCNNTASPITPGAITLNWRVTR